MVYYAETNLIAVIVGIILLLHGRKTSSKNETSQLVMNGMLIMLIVLSLCDVMAFYFRGKSYIGVQLSNVAYFASMAIGCYLWFLFIMIKTEKVHHLRKTILTTCVPALILCVMILLNPVTGYFFSIDGDLLYHRGPGVLFSWIIEWGYILAAIAINTMTVMKEKRDYKRSEYKGYILFLIPMAAAAVCQMLFYGTTTTQIGFVIALLLVYLNKQQFQMQRDDLTGLNNKNAFLSYRDSMVNKARAQELTLFMIDADKFKYVNDTFGHIKGDQALIDIADALKKASSVIRKERVILFRYAGDEFVIVSNTMDEEEVAKLLRAIDENISLKNEANNARGEAYTLSVSTGYAHKSCKDLADFDSLFLAADDAMYREKEAKGVKR